jgi:uncharacterized phage protein (TIGR01671 family)
MIREIKFRAKCARTGEWKYGFLSNHSTLTINSVRLKIDQSTIGEYTGLKDKNGKEIYEGDILENKEHSFKFKIQWGIENESYAGWAGNWLNKDFISPLYNKPLENCEVIGNIHQHKKILK